MIGLAENFSCQIRWDRSIFHENEFYPSQLLPNVGQHVVWKNAGCVICDYQSFLKIHFSIRFFMATLHTPESIHLSALRCLGNFFYHNGSTYSCMLNIKALNSLTFPSKRRNPAGGPHGANVGLHLALPLLTKLGNVLRIYKFIQQEVQVAVFPTF